MKSDEWLTPPDILNKLGEFDMDPCSPINRPWDTARVHFNKDEDGLSKQWEGRVWLNPPFGKEAVKWIRKFSEHRKGILLIPARTETKMFFDYIWPFATGILFIKGRPSFYTVDGTKAPFNSGAPIVLVSYTAQDDEALRKSGLGEFVSLNNGR
jgi:hypothetical protein